MKFKLRSRATRGRVGADRESGQVMVLFALSLLALLLIVSVAIDGGFGLLQYRQAQNAADFASEAAAQALFPQCTDNTAAFVSGTQIVADINAVVHPNSPSTRVVTSYGWSGYYLNSANQELLVGGQPVPIYDPASGSPVTAPAGACGVTLDVSPQWPPFIAQIMGVVSLKTAAGAAAVNPGSLQGPQTSIASLGQNGAHTILNAGKGVFDIEGTIYDNSNGCLDTPSVVSSTSPPNCNRWGGGDVLDGKQGGLMYDWGQFEYAANAVPNPWDGCFSSSSENAAAGKNSGVISSSWPPGNPPSNLPTYPIVCAPPNNLGGEPNIVTDIYVDGWQPSGSPQQVNVLPVSPQDPTPSDAGCVAGGAPGLAVPNGAGGTTYYPGVYSSPVVVTGNAVFDNCSQELGTNSVPPQPGIFYFQQGLALEPGPGDTVSGNDVLLATGGTLPNGVISATNHNQGDGEPVIGAGSSNCSIDSAGDEQCTGPAASPNPCSAGNNASSWSGTNCNADDTAAGGGFQANVVKKTKNCGQYPVSCAGQGLNDSIYMGGQGTITLSAPQNGPYNQFLLWQISTVQANIGLDTLLGDSANINLTGVLVDDSNPAGQNPANEQYWDGPGGVPFVSGGMLLAGYGVAFDPNYPGDGSAYGSWGTGFTCGPGTAGANGQGCNITINGLALVDLFQTEGYTQLAIDGSGIVLPFLKSGAILTG